MLGPNIVDNHWKDVYNVNGEGFKLPEKRTNSNKVL